MKRKLTHKQERAYRLVSGEFTGLSVKMAAIVMHITPQAVNRLLSRARTTCPQLFPLLTKQEVNVRDLLAAGSAKAYIADHLQVSLRRVDQIIESVNEKRGSIDTKPVKMVSYQPYMDSQIRKKF